MLRLVAFTSLLSLVAACACGGSSTAPANPGGGTGTGTGAGTDPGNEPGAYPQPRPAFDVNRLGAPCGEGSGGSDGCVAPTKCVSYYGIAGPSGPEFKSCEITCADKAAACPEGASCITIADGPGAVCRADDPSGEPPPVVNE